MKRLRMITGVLSVLSCTVFVNADTAAISFNSLKIPAGTYEPERDVIVYVVNSSGAFVRTIATWGDDLEDDTPWKTVSSSSRVDATSSATVKGTASQALTALWDGKDANKTAVPSGSYWLIISANSRDRNSSPSRLMIKLEIGGPTKTITTADSSISNGLGCLTDLNVVFTGGVKVINQVVSGNKIIVKLGDTPIYIPYKNEKNITISFFSLNGARVMKQIIPVNARGNQANIPLNIQASGTYMCKIATKSATISQRVTLQ